MLACSVEPVIAFWPVTNRVSRYWFGDVGQNWTFATQLCPGDSVEQELDGML